MQSCSTVIASVVLSINTNSIISGYSTKHYGKSGPQVTRLMCVIIAWPILKNNVLGSLPQMIPVSASDSVQYCQQLNNNNLTMLDNKHLDNGFPEEIK